MNIDCVEERKPHEKHLRIAFGLALILAALTFDNTVEAVQQEKDKKPWTEWSQKDAEKILTSFKLADMMLDGKLEY